MKEFTFFRFFLIGLIISFALAIASFYSLRSLNESSVSEVRKNFIQFIIKTVESSPYAESVQNMHFHANKLSPGSNLWVISEAGTVLASNTDSALPMKWQGIKKPIAIHDFLFIYRSFRLVSDLILVKLDDKNNRYLLIGSKGHPSFAGPLWVQVSFFFFVIGIGFLIALALLYSYLRQKSREVRRLLLRLEKGELHARFEIKGLDEINSLMLDFNRMASEIERLVHRLQETEVAKKNLLEELSHDIRTPLTSLKTSIETLWEHLDVMPIEVQREFLNVSRLELVYFLHLIEDLFFIASLGEPRYKKSTQRIDLAAMVSAEVQSRKSQQKMTGTVARKEIHWEFTFDPSFFESTLFLGDPWLIQRLLKNAFDNAAKHAKSVARIQIQPTRESVCLIVENDGAEISDLEKKLFAQRKRLRKYQQDCDQTASLGLGSVIMKTIVELHGGELQIERLTPSKIISQGTRLILRLPKLQIT